MSRRIYPINVIDESAILAASQEAFDQKILESMSDEYMQSNGFFQQPQAAAAWLKQFFPNVFMPNVHGSERAMQKFARVGDHEFRYAVLSEKRVPLSHYQRLMEAVGMVFGVALKFKYYKAEEFDGVLDKQPLVIIGRDNRKTSELVAAHMAIGLQKVGCRVMNAGVLPGIVLYYLAKIYKCSVVHVTASHYDIYFTGFKLTFPNGQPVFGEKGLEKMVQLAVAGAFNEFGKEFLNTEKILEQARGPKITYINGLEQFVNEFGPRFASRHYSKVKKVAIEAYRGACTEMITKILQAAGFEVIDAQKVSFNVDYQVGSISDFEVANPGDYPRTPDPQQKHSLARLHLVVEQYGCDMGISLDGDGDRIVFMDKFGRVIPADRIACLIATMYYRDKDNNPINQGKVFMIDERSGWILRETITNLGGNYRIQEVGHVGFVKTMQELGIERAAEFANHFYYLEDMNCNEHPIQALFDVLAYLEQYNQFLHEAVQPFGKHWHSGEINFAHITGQSNFDKFSVMISEEFAAQQTTKVSAHTTSVLYDFGTWRFLARRSHTEPIIRLTVESMVSRQDLVYKLQVLYDMLLEAGYEEPNLTDYTCDLKEFIDLIPEYENRKLARVSQGSDIPVEAELLVPRH